MAIELQANGESLFVDIDDGHCILLIEEKDGPKTFKEYSTVPEFLASVVNMYEDYRKGCCVEKSFHDWMGSFIRFEVFTFDKKLGRYHLIKRDKLEEEFEETDDENQTN